MRLEDPAEAGKDARLPVDQRAVAVERERVEAPVVERRHHHLHTAWIAHSTARWRAPGTVGQSVDLDDSMVRPTRRERLARLVELSLLPLTAGGLVLGLAFTWAGQDERAAIVWAVPSIVVGARLAWSIAVDLAHGNAGVDVIAILAIVGASRDGRAPGRRGDRGDARDGRGARAVRRGAGPPRADLPPRAGAAGRPSVRGRGARDAADRGRRGGRPAPREARRGGPRRRPGRRVGSRARRVGPDRRIARRRARRGRPGQLRHRERGVALRPAGHRHGGGLHVRRDRPPGGGGGTLARRRSSGSRTGSPCCSSR